MDQTDYELVRRSETVAVKEWDDAFEVPLVDFITELQALMATIPPEHLLTTTLTFDPTGGDMDRSYGELRVEYTVLEPEGEWERRKALILERRAEHLKAQQEMHDLIDRAKYEELKKKYGAA